MSKAKRISNNDTSSSDRASRGNPSYQLFVLVLSLFALALMALQTSVDSSSATREIIDYADFGICVFFLVDFIVCFAKAENRWKYFITWGWLDLLSSIPAIDVARWGRAARILRVFRVLRGVRASKLIASVILKRRTENIMLAAVMIVILLLTFCSIAVLHFETDENSNIRSAEDAIWWSFTTATTVGYGDRYPVTREGRIVAVVLMCGGFCILGILSGLFASWFVGPSQRHQDEEFTALRDEVRALREVIEKQNKQK